MKNYLKGTLQALLITFISCPLVFATKPLGEEELKENARHNRVTLESVEKQVKNPDWQGPWGVDKQDAEEAFAKNPNLVCIMEFGKCFKRLNFKWKEVLGWELEELLNTPYYEFIHPEDLEKTVEYENNFIPTGFINRYRCKDGSYRYLSWVGLTNLHKDKDLPSFAIAMDVTFNMLLEEESTTQIKVLNEHLNFHTRVVKALTELQRLYLGKLGNYGDEKDIDRSLQHIIQHFVHLSGSEFGFMCQVVQEAGRKILPHKTWEANVSLSPEKQGLYEKCQQESEGLLYFNTLVNEVINTGKPILINEMQKYFEDIGASEHSPSFKSFLGVPLFSKEEMVGILALANREYGYNQSVIEWFEPLFLLTGRIINETNLLRFRQEANEQRLEKERAEERTEAKSRFLALMSHELRTPLGGLLGLLDLINKEHLTEEEGGYLQTAQEAGDSLLSIINDILDLSKIEENKLILEAIPFNPIQVAQDAVRLLSFAANKKHLKLTLSTDVNIPEVLTGDPTRLRQIFMNLVGNAIKFTEKGSVKVSLKGKPVEEEGKEGMFSLRGKIKDTGIGISSEKQALLFRPFTQADPSLTRRYGGTGLGLYITKSLCELMDGSIVIKSKEQKGTIVTFNVTLPFSETTVQKQSPSSLQKLYMLPPLHVLIVEDYPTNQLLLRKMLENSGCFVTVAENGLEAITEFNKGAYDLILMDGQMPVMDGLEATRRIRDIKLPRAKTIPIIGVTAHAITTDRERFLEAGMNGYLTKPIRKNELYAEIKRCLEEIKQYTKA